MANISVQCRSTHLRYFIKKVLLKISQNLQKNTGFRISFLIKLQALGLQLYLKKRLGTSVFLWVFCEFLVKFLRTSSLQNTSRRLLHCNGKIILEKTQKGRPRRPSFLCHYFLSITIRNHWFCVLLFLSITLLLQILSKH